MKTIALALVAPLALLAWAVPAAAEMNTVDLDAAMEKCRQHMTSAQGQFVFQSGWEDCSAIEKIWSLKQGGGKTPPEQDKADVHNALMRALGQ
jgi:uncharacterized membrane protein